MSQKKLRFVIYAHYSSDMQNEISLEDQETLCRQAVAERGGVIVAVFKDGARSGWSLDRDGFNELRAAARRKRFDAVMLWKFDRLARDHNHSVMIKILLRNEYGLKLYCVEGFSEDEDNSPYTAMMEQMLAVFSAFYSRNLSSDTKRAKHQRAIRGEFNGSVPPLGYDLVTQADATEEQPAGLYINPWQAALVRRAFRLYATGNYSDNTIADWLNARPLIQQLRAGKKPIGKEMVRDMLQNRVYTGRVPYCETLYNGGLGQGKQSSRHRKQWFEGKHEGFISDDLFAACLAARAQLTRLRKPVSTVRTYVLHDRVYCARCVAEMPHGLDDDNYGKMRPYWDHRRACGYYRCLSKDRGYGKCTQRNIREMSLNEQVVAVLSNLEIPMGFKERVEIEVRTRVENEASLKRMADIQAIIERMDFRWDHGFINQAEYIEKRQQLQQEIEALRPIDYEELMEAANLIEHFKVYWDKCEGMDDPALARQQLLTKIVDRVFVYDQQVVAVTLHGDFSVVLNESQSAPREIMDALENGLATLDPARSRNGSDGLRAILCTILLCYHPSRRGGVTLWSDSPMLVFHKFLVVIER